MVRLKAAPDTSIVNRLIFQFQYGAIEGWYYRKSDAHCFISIPVWCDWRTLAKKYPLRIYPFQFQYGAIEGMMKKYIPIGMRNFNSSMVRLKGHRYGRNLLSTLISIPVWCDWRFCCFHFFVFVPLFQFQYGAIEGAKPTHVMIKLINFNSSMVRLKAATRVASEHWRPISIPVWCDWRRTERSSG